MYGLILDIRLEQPKHRQHHWAGLGSVKTDRQELPSQSHPWHCQPGMGMEGLGVGAMHPENPPAHRVNAKVPLTFLLMVSSLTGE